MEIKKFEITAEDVTKLNTKKGLLAMLSKNPVNLERAVRYVDYERKLKKLQVELVKLQSWAYRLALKTRNRQIDLINIYFKTYVFVSFVKDDFTSPDLYFLVR